MSNQWRVWKRGINDSTDLRSTGESATRTFHSTYSFIDCLHRSLLSWMDSMIPANMSFTETSLMLLVALGLLAEGIGRSPSCGVGVP
jgi:hypothetical protein